MNNWAKRAEKKLQMVMNTSIPLVPNVDPDLDPCTNYTTAWQWLSSVQPTYLVVISMVGVVGNSLVICVLRLQRKPATVADIYLGNLATSDLAMTFCLPFWGVTIARGYHWAFGEAFCKIVNMVISMNYYCSILFLTLVSLDRYLALVKPMVPSRLRRAALAKRICLGIWVLGFLVSLPILLFRTVQYVTDPGVDACILAYPHPAWILQWNITVNVLGFVIPVVVVTYCNCHIVLALKYGTAMGLSRVRAEKRSTQLVLAVLTVFLICWTPFQLMRLLDTLDYFQLMPGCLWGHILDIGIQLSTYLAYSNSVVNPFLYVIVGKHFRKKAKEVFGGKKSLSLPATTVNTSIELKHISLEKLAQI